ncbi:GFA family protein [Acanthopleuribacter pedis]|uniref:GFA family protein n=1 Tax=Acanthopleuribacter pedis TaxID=442870 RepID=A0A8J7U3Z8_9BACT|nr:GFA family protein [Acanthopleuribacter pedis]MBO1319289.1 GFA family protein [Acanthopleuribacter pedis]
MTQNLSYHGSCHCGGVAFTIQSPRITDALRCNCSICRRRNALMSKAYYPPPCFQLHQGRDQLQLYQWGDGDVNHYFCKRCGIYPFHEATQKPGLMRINLGCLEGFDLETLEVTLFDGAELL